MATALSPHPALSLSGSNWRRLGLISWSAILIVSWLAANVIARDRTTLLSIMRAIVWSGGIVSIYGILQYLGVDPFIAPSSYLAGEGVFTIVRPPGTLGHADYFGCYLLYVSWYALAMAGSEKGYLRVATIAIAALAVAALILSGTRAALLGLIASGAVGLPFYFRVFRRSYVLPAIAALALCGVFVASPLGAKFRARIQWSATDPFGGARPVLWKDAAAMVAMRPLQGFGLETFSTEFPRFQSLQLARAYPDFYQESPHNMLLDAATSQGLLAPIILLALVAYGLRTGWRVLQTERPLAVCLGAALVATTVAQQFTVFIVPTCLLFYLTVSMLTGVSVGHASQRSGTYATQLAIKVAGCGLALVFATAGVRLAASDAALLAALKAVRQKHVEAASRFYSRARAWQLPGVNSDLLYSRVMAAASGDQSLSAEDRALAWEQALDAGLRAPDTSEDRQNAYFNLAALMIDQGDLVAAGSELRLAIKASPNWYKPHWALAQILQRMGRHNESVEEAVAAQQRMKARIPK